MSDFFDIFASCCGERNPKKIKTKARSESREKVDEDKDKDKDKGHKAPFFEPSQAEVDKKNSLDECLSVESPRELLLFESSLSNLELLILNLELLISNLLKSPPSSSPTSPPRARTPNSVLAPASRKSLHEVVEIRGDLLSSSTPPHSPRKSDDRLR